MITSETSDVYLYTRGSVELACWPENKKSHKPYREWKKSQKKLRREKRQRNK